MRTLQLEIFIANDKMSTLPPILEVINGKEVSTVDDLIVILDMIVADVVARFVYDWLKSCFKGGD